MDPCTSLSIKEHLVKKGERAYVTEVVTLTLFSHSNSVHMLRNWNKRSARRHQCIGTGTYLSLGAVRRLDVVHNIDVNVVQDDALFSHSWSLPQDAPENDTSFCRRNFDGSFDALEAMWSNGIDRGPLHEL